MIDVPSELFGDTSIRVGVPQTTILTELNRVLLDPHFLGESTPCGYTRHLRPVAQYHLGQK